MAEGSTEPGRAARLTGGFPRSLLEVAGGGLEELISVVQAVETMQLGVTITNLAGRILYVNPADAHMHGWEPSELTGLDIAVYVPGGKRHILSAEELRGMRSWRRESMNARRDGSQFPVQLLSDIVHDTSGNPFGIITTCEDISARRAAEAALAESRASLAAVIENNRDAIWSVDLEGRLKTFNSAVVGGLGTLLREAPRAGASWREMLAEAHGPAWNEWYARALGGERFTTQVTVDGGREPRYLEVSFNPILSDGRVSGACTFARDVTLRRRSEEVLHDLQARYDAARGANDGLWDWDLVHHRVVFSRRCMEMLGDDGEQEPWSLEGWLDRAHADDRDALWVELSNLIDGKAEQCEVEHRMRHRDGSWRWMLTRGAGVRDADGRTVRVAGSQIDVTARRTAEEALRDSEQRYALAARGANDGLWDWDIERGTIYYSPRWKAMLGYAAGEVAPVLQAWLDLVHPDDVARMQADVDQHLSGESPHFESEYRARHRDGGWRWMLCRGLAVRTFFGKAVRMAGSQTDITDRKRAEEQLLRDAFHDSLTGLPNRALFSDRLGLALARAKRNAAYQFAVLFIDLDRFKVVNESLGHAMGDRVLLEIASRVHPCVRAVDTLARLGGDEFALLLDGIDDLRDATNVSSRILEGMQAPFRLDGRDVFMGASIGIVIGTAAYRHPDELLRDADIATYRAKAAGRGRHQIFDAQMHAHTVELLQMESDLRRALERRQLLLYYQPLVDLTSGAIAGFEALSRWQHPEWGLVSPARFIPLAEETGLIVDLGIWSLREACRQLVAWDDAGVPGRGELHVSVNASGRQLVLPELGSQVLAVLREERLSPHRLGLEMTESVLMENVDGANQGLAQMRAAGINVHLDDFGTGYSSLSYLPRFPIDALKVDRSFVSRMIDHAADRVIVQSVIDLAHNLGKQVMAEGIETAQQLAALRELGCDVAQGYFFAKPLPAADAEALLRREPRW